MAWKQRYSCFVFQIMKRNLNNVKRMTSHPVYQYCKCQFETCSSSLHSPHPLSDAKLCSLSLLPPIPVYMPVLMHVDIHQI